MEFDRDLRARQEVRLLAQQAQQAFEGLQKLDQSGLDRITEALSRAGALHATELAREACAETGFGNERDKTEKNRFAAVRVFGAIRGLRTVGILRRDDERRVWDVGVPVGVIAGIVPSTNPTSTVIYKSLIALKAGSPIVFSPHPHAVRCTLHAARLMAEAAEAAGCPKGAISCLTMPSLDAVQELLHAPQVRLILATGGGAMVRAAYSSGKPAIGVGAGNGPAYIHRSADIPRAVRDILRSKTFDNGTVCASEQSVIVERCCEARVREEFRKQGCYFLNTEEAGRVARLLLRPDGTINPKVVGRTACAVARMAGVTVPESTPVLLANETEAAPALFPREALPHSGIFRRGGRGHHPPPHLRGAGGRGCGPHVCPARKGRGRRPPLRADRARFALSRQCARVARRHRRRDGPVPCAHARLRRGGRQLVVQ